MADVVRDGRDLMNAEEARIERLQREWHWYQANIRALRGLGILAPIVVSDEDR